MSKKKTFYKYIYIFIGCCIVGFTVETLWCLVKNGYIESRKSLVYGPFSVAYGMGGMLLTAVLDKIKDSSPFRIFAVSFAVGTVAEYICSLGQEIVFGSVAWDYSHLPLNINGRVCLLYSLFWGALGILWIKLILPFFDRITNKISDKLSDVIVWSFIIFFIFDATLSALAAFRMDERQLNKAPSNQIEVFLDKHFDDERMHKIYANSKEVS